MSETKKPLPEPLPCPWCGESPRIVPHAGRISVHCLNSKCKVEAFTDFKPTKAQAITIWNNRKAVSSE